LFFKKHIKLQQLFITQLLPTCGMKMFLKKCSGLFPRPAEIRQHLITLCDQITRTDGYRGLLGTLSWLDLSKLSEKRNQVGIPS
jgi:hypothetical protein